VIWFSFPQHCSFISLVICLFPFVCGLHLREGRASLLLDSLRYPQNLEQYLHKVNTNNTWWMNEWCHSSRWWSLSQLNPTKSKGWLHCHQTIIEPKSHYGAQLPRTHNPPVSVSQVLGLQECTITLAGCLSSSFFFFFCHSGVWTQGPLPLKPFHQHMEESFFLNWSNFFYIWTQTPLLAVPSDLARILDAAPCLIIIPSVSSRSGTSDF
jgi:hypothetical protein